MQLLYGDKKAAVPGIKTTLSQQQLLVLHQTGPYKSRPQLISYGGASNSVLPSICCFSVEIHCFREMCPCSRMVGLTVRQFLSTSQVTKIQPHSLWRRQHLLISSSRSSSDRRGGGDDGPTLPNFDYALICSVKPWPRWLQQEMRSNQAREMTLHWWWRRWWRRVW